MMNRLHPNVFLIGVQKSATTSVYDWMAQHPDICGPVSMKDTPFFIDDKLYNKGVKFLEQVYRPEYRDQKVILNGSAHNIYFEHALKRMAEFQPDAKLILILRDPVERAFSAYKFAKKRNLEDMELEAAIADEPNRIAHPDLKIQSETTYVDHGLYHRQIQRLYQYFKPEQVRILLYEDIREQPETIMHDIYSFIGVDATFTPDYRKLNQTGSVRYTWIKNMVYNDSKWKQFLLKYIIDPILPYNLKYRLKLFFLRAMTGKAKNDSGQPDVLTHERANWLRSYFIEDIQNLETLIGRDLTAWKS
ncbi:Sulfotransferase domain-containing protein [Robiginitalea myxolifaciens]|uniref:Sulfotransferase domain-containing protein n=1 Tax=Robiginitalea myxolifaciens TaxID=400055 RepID=A0A1I6G2K8_9FLAO|nr:sulfotransferase [Robiginitalea myxolifaciens]SFR36419.1 Sulfotransferase domain-containing protein [Robiginitalea myxolifaciens]